MVFHVRSYQSRLIPHTEVRIRRLPLNRLLTWLRDRDRRLVGPRWKGFVCTSARYQQQKSPATPEAGSWGLWQIRSGLYRSALLGLYANAQKEHSGKLRGLSIDVPESQELHPRTMTLVRIRDALARTYYDVDRNHTLQMAAALSYYFVLSVFPVLILLSAVVAYFPLPDLFDQALNLIGQFLPPDCMGLVRRILSDVITPNKATFLSFGILGTLWAASGGFSAAIEALDIAYDVEDDRPFWKTRTLAVVLAFVTEALVLLALSVMIVGPKFGEWLAHEVHVANVFVLLWPYIHWSVAIGFTLLAVEALYFMAPNVKQRFLATLPGAILAVGCWIALSYLLGLYFRHFANFNKTYGTLGGAAALMVWLYWTAFAMLVGAELNAELAKISNEGRIEGKHEPSVITRIDLVA
jgi:membrane protein